MSDVLKSTTERKLLQNYNGKPVMMKPQNRYYIGSNYLEIDVDVHGYVRSSTKVMPLPTGTSLRGLIIAASGLGMIIHIGCAEKQ